MQKLMFIITSILPIMILKTESILLREWDRIFQGGYLYSMMDDYLSLTMQVSMLPKKLYMNLHERWIHCICHRIKSFSM